MPKSAKRKRSRSRSDEFQSFAKKLKRLVDSVEESPSRRRRRRRIIESSSSQESSREPSPSPETQQDGDQAESRNDEEVRTPAPPAAAGGDARDIALADIIEAGTSSTPASEALPNESSAPTEDTLDEAVLQILGEDPTSTVEYGKEVHVQLANRFEYLATTGLTKEARKELCDKYLVPSNCTRVGAPILNAEIKAALNENLMKRDKAIEARQKPLACAISCVAQIATEQLGSTDTNHDVLKKAMDAGRLLSDLQYAESVTRRNFATFSLKKDMKEHLFNTKIDKFLFGESLPDALKTAKAVTKSGTDLKVDAKKKPPPRTTTTAQRPAARNLNWKPPAPARRQLEPPRGREPAAPRVPPETSSKQSPYPRRITRRR